MYRSNTGMLGSKLNVNQCMRLQSVVLVVALIFEILQRIVEFIDRIIPYSICAVNNQIGHVSEANKWLMPHIIMLITTSRNTFLHMLDVFMAFLRYGVIIMFENLMLLHNYDILIARFFVFVNSYIYITA